MTTQNPRPVRRNLSFAVSGERKTLVDDTIHTGSGDTEEILTGSETWSDIEHGYAYVVATTTDLSGSSDQYLFDLSDNSSNPAASIRIAGTVDLMSCRYRDDSGNITSGSQASGFDVFEDVKRGYGLIWNNNTNTVKLVSQGVTQTYSGLSSGTFTQHITRLNIGHRTSSLNPIIGTVGKWGVGSGDITEAELSRLMRSSDAYIICGAGQSLSVGHWDGQEASGHDGFNSQVTTLQAFSGFTDREIISVSGGTGGSAIDERANAVNYWWDSVADKEGTSLIAWHSYLGTYNYRPDFIIWSQGETDSHSIDKVGEISRAEYKETILKVFNRMRDLINPNMVFGIQKIGRRASFSNTGGVQTIREIQEEIASENDWIYILSESYDQPLTDDVHPTDAGYGVLGTRAARRIAYLNGETVSGSTIGMQITSAVRSGTTVTVTVSHDGGSDFTPTTGIEGFTFHDDGAEITINSAVRTDATTITLTLASTPTGAEVLYYGYDAMVGINTANIVKDNSAQALPMQASKLTL